MANNFMLNISEDFDMESMANEITEMYQGKGYAVRTLKMRNGFKITVEKGVGGINMLLGLGRGITATCTVNGKSKDMLNVNFSDGDWMGKIIGLVAGLFLCMIPFITAIIGILRQTNLQKDFANDIQMSVCNGDDN